MYRLQSLIPKRHRDYAMHLLTQIVRWQRWGIPPVAPGGWKLHFKGGWSGAPSWRVNQVMLLRRPPRRFSVAILTREQPSMAYGEQSIEGVAKRLLAPLQPRQPLQQVAEDARGRAPDQVLADHVGRGADRDAAADQAAHREALAQLARARKASTVSTSAGFGSKLERRSAIRPTKGWTL